MSSIINFCRICYEENIENANICNCTSYICKNCLIKEVEYTEKERSRLECTICRIPYKKIYKNDSFLFYFSKALMSIKDPLMYRISSDEKRLLIISLTILLLWNISTFPIYNISNNGLIIFIDIIIFVVNIIIYNKFIFKLYNFSIYLLFFPLMIYSIRYYLNMNNSYNPIFPFILIMDIIVYIFNLTYILRDNYRNLNMEICIDD